MLYLGGHARTAKSMKPFPLTVAGVRARLAQIQRERDALIALEQVYAEYGDPSATEHDRHADLKPGAALVALYRRDGNTVLNGTTAAIFKTVDEKPGITKSALIDEVLAQVETAAKKPRRSVSNIISQQVGKQKLAVRQGGYYRA